MMGSAYQTDLPNAAWASVWLAREAILTVSSRFPEGLRLPVVPRPSVRYSEATGHF